MNVVESTIDAGTLQPKPTIDWSLPLSLSLVVVVTCGYLQYKQVNAKRRILVQDPTHQWDIAGRENVVRQPYNDHSLLREFILDTRDDRCRICSNHFCPWRNKYI